MIYDSHFHILDAMDAGQVIDRAGRADRVVACGLPWHGFASISNRWVVETAERSGGRILPLVFVDDDVEKWLKKGAVGAKEHVYLQRRAKLDGGPGEIRRWERQYKAIEAAGVPLLYHGGPDVLDRLGVLSEIAPRMRVILAHLGWVYSVDYSPDVFRDWVLNISRECAGHDRIMFDCSDVISRFPNGVDVLIEAREILGEGRILWGSDWPMCDWGSAFDSAVEMGELFDEMAARTPEEIWNVAKSA